MGQTVSLSVTAYFRDPEGTSMSCVFEGKNSSVSTSGCAFTGKAEGSATLRMKATDAGGLSTKSNSFTVTVRPPPPEIKKFTANPSSICSGGSSTLSWSISGATSASINQGVGSVNRTSGTRSVSPTTTTTYTLTARNSGGTAYRDVTVSVSGPRIHSITPSLQRPDDPVTISGSCFGTTQGSVSFGGSSATINSWSNSSIGVLIPRWLSPGTVSVTVTANGKTSNSYSYTVTGSPLQNEKKCKEGEKECDDPDEEEEEPEAEEESGSDGEGEEEASPEEGE